MPAFPGGSFTFAAPTHDAPHPQAEDVFYMQARVRRLLEESEPIRSHRRFPRKSFAVRGGNSAFKRAVVAHVRRHAGNIVPVEGLVEFKHDADGRLDLGHADRTHA
jgi:hypothetical protein